VRDAVRRDLSLVVSSSDGGEKQYRLNDEIATLLIRPRGWHLVERHVEIGGDPLGVVFDEASATVVVPSGNFFKDSKAA
jgi:malate synthase